MNLSNITVTALMASLSLSAFSTQVDAQKMGNRDDMHIVSNLKTAQRLNAPMGNRDDVQIGSNSQVLEARISDTDGFEITETPVQMSTLSQDLDQLENLVYSDTDYLSMSMSDPLMPMGSDIPANARPGECYGKVLIPAVTEDITDRIQVSQEQQVIARTIPAQYEVRQEKILVSPGRQYWKAGRGPVEQVNQLTGEIMCLIEEPPVYQTIEKRILVAPEMPEYKTQPAAFETITRSRVVQPERTEWRRILCETNVTPDVVTNIQQALLNRGYNVGAVDGQFNKQTLGAINQYQVNNGLATRGITHETLSSLGVSILRM